MGNGESRREDTTVNANVSGGTNVTIGGRNVTAKYQGAQSVQPQEIHELIELLRRELDAHADEVDDPDALRESADFLERELLEREQPNPGTIRVMLAGMASAAGQVASVVDAVARIQRVVAPMF